MDFLRTLKKRRPKKHVSLRISVAPPSGGKPKARGTCIRRRGTTLSLALCFALLLALRVVTQVGAEDYYIYRDPEGKLVISNKEPPPGSKIIKRLPQVTDREIPQAEAQEPRKTPPTEDSLKPSGTK